MKSKDQSGFAVIEAVLLVAVVLALGYGGFRIWQARRTGQSGVASSVSTAPNGSVDNTVNALVNDSTHEAAAGNQSDNEASEVTATSSAAQSIEGSYNENSF